MKLVIFGLSVSSAWGNGHATLWRALFFALRRTGHRVVFFERDVPYYAAHRDPVEACGCDLRLYSSWDATRKGARLELADADAAIVTSYCPDAVAAAELSFSSPVRVCAFYDLDTPVTLDAIRQGKPVPYMGPDGLREFDLVLSYTGGQALTDLTDLLGAKRVAPLYGSVDPSVHAPVSSPEQRRADLSYLGTYAADRQQALESLFFGPARRLPNARFLLGGAQYPSDLVFPGNVSHVPHVAPVDHPRFYCSSSLTLNVTRRAMAASGYCPSGRLFEAAACGVPVLSDVWPGIDLFFEPGREILLARSTDEAMAALSLSPETLAAVGARARTRALVEHTAEHRAAQLLDILSADRSGQRPLAASGIEAWEREGSQTA